MVNAICIIGDLFELLAKIQYFDKTLTKKRNSFWVITVWVAAFVLDEYLALNVQSVWNIVICVLLMFLSICI